MHIFDETEDDENLDELEPIDELEVEDQVSESEVVKQDKNQPNKTDGSGQKKENESTKLNKKKGKEKKKKLKESKKEQKFEKPKKTMDIEKKKISEKQKIEKKKERKKKAKLDAEKKKIKKRSITARKLPITGKARKLPIEEADEDVDIDWSTDDSTEEDKAFLNFEISKLEEKARYLERAKMNAENELQYIKPDLENKNRIINEIKDDYERLRSDFDKYKSRMRSEIKEKQRYATERLIEELLEVLDNFDRTNNLDIATADKEDITKGIQMIHNQIMDLLQKEGLKPITANGEPFDPYIHDAMATTKTDDYPHNTILEELQKGYMLKDKVIRPSKVRVSQSDVRPAIQIKRKKEELKKKKDKGKKIDIKKKEGKEKEIVKKKEKIEEKKTKKIEPDFLEKKMRRKIVDKDKKIKKFKKGEKFKRFKEPKEREFERKDNSELVEKHKTKKFESKKEVIYKKGEFEKRGMDIKRFKKKHRPKQI